MRPEIQHDVRVVIKARGVSAAPSKCPAADDGCQERGSRYPRGLGELHDHPSIHACFCQKVSYAPGDQHSMLWCTVGAITKLPMLPRLTYLHLIRKAGWGDGTFWKPCVVACQA